MKYHATVTRGEPLNTNPFPGLRSYNADEADRFFGRRDQVRELQMRLRRNRFLAVVGTSGSGKSSLVCAGLLPRLENDPATRWHTIITSPADEPLTRLARRIAYSSLHASSPVEGSERTMMVEASLRRSSLGLVEAVRQTGVDGRVIVVVDQFEELFRIRRAEHGALAEEEAARYVRLLLEAARQTAQPICVVLTLRADYIGDCARFSGLAEALNGGQYLVPRLTREGRREVIAGPVELGGATVAPRLLHRLLNDVGDNPDQLPILQHAMMRTWEHWRRREAPELPVDLEDYEAIGTMAEALERHAEETFSALDPETGGRAAERLFKRLTEKGADNRETRHPSRYDDVCAAAGCAPAQMQKVVDHFRRSECSFVLPGLVEPLEGDTLLDISHESLIRVWGRLRAWVDRESQDGAAYVELASRAGGYLGPEKTEDVLTGQTLRRFEEWRERVEPNAAWARRYPGDFAHAIDYLDISAREHARRVAEQQAAAAREARQNRLIARGVWILLFLFLAALGGAGYAFKQRNEAETQRNEAETQRNEAETATKLATSRQLATAAEGALLSDPELGLLLALHAVDQTYPKFVIDATTSLNRAVQVMKRQTLVSRFGLGTAGAAIGADGQRIVAVGRNGLVDVLVRDPLDDEAPYELDRDCAVRADECRLPVTAAAISADLGTVAVGSSDGSVVVLRSSGSTPRIAAPEKRAGPVTALALDARGVRLVSVDRQGRMTFDRVEAASLHRVADLVGHTGSVSAFAMDTGGTRLLAADENGVARLWDLDQCASGAGSEPVECEAAAILVGPGRTITSAVFGPGSPPLFATGDVDGNVLIWGTQGSMVSFRTEPFDSAITVLAFGTDRARPIRLAVGTRQGQVGVWEDGSELGIGHMVDSAHFSRGGASVLAHTARITSLRFDALGTQLASGSAGARVKIWDVASGKRKATLRAQGGWVTSLEFAEAGHRLLSADDAGRVVLWHTPNPTGTRSADKVSWKRDVLVTELENGVSLVAAIAGGDVVLLKMDETGKVIRRQQIIAQERVKELAAFSNPARIVTRADDGLEREYILDPEVLVKVAAGLLGARELSPAECERYLYARDCELRAAWGIAR